MPTQIQTYSQVGAGLSAGELLPNHAAASNRASATRPTVLSNHLVGLASTIRLSTASGVPAEISKRGLDQKAARAKKETATAAAAE